MDQRPDQLDERGWAEDRSTALPRSGERGSDERIEVEMEAVDFDDSETERIKAEIEDTRAEMGQTINEIQERLSPEHLMDQVKETVREATIGKVERVMDRVGEKISNVTEPARDAMGRAGETIKQTGTSLTNTIKENPIPCALIGLGLGMFVVRRIRGGSERTWRTRAYQPEFEAGMAMPSRSGMGRQYYGASGEYAGASRQYGSERSTLMSMKDTAGEWAHGTAERVSHLGHQAKEQAFRAGRGFQHLLEENPLAVSAAAVAVGAAVGLALPATRIEQEYMGDASEKLVDKAQQVARDAMDKVKTATQGEQQQPGRQQPGQQQQAGQSQPNQAQAGKSQPDSLQPGQSQGGQSQGGQKKGRQSQPNPPTRTA
ncbi:MAG TPA: DUF3618 domain-containing protein [Pyrinomonadaceae bacterium]|nr:DUF3618 domain-containing protein [Pyrinomonadaceae bacterium]